MLFRSALAENVTADVFYTYEKLASGTAGNTYTANSNTANVNGFTALSGNACDTYTTLLQRNNNNKLDPCLNWSVNMLDKASTAGAGVRKQAEKLEVTGHLPEQLSGAYLRNGSNPQFAPLGAYHWFDGDGMVHGVYLEGGRARYRNRWVETPGLLHERRAGRALFGAAHFAG